MSIRWLLQTNGLEQTRSFFDAKDDEPADEFGLPFRVHYLLVGLIAFFVGFVTLIFASFPSGEQLRHPVVIAICLAGIAVPLFFAAFARRSEYEFRESLVIAVLLLAILGPFICSFYIGSLRPAFVTLYMLGPIGIAYYVPLRRAWPVIAMGVGAILIVSTRIDEPDAMLRGAIVASITIATSLMLAGIRSHLARTVASNQEIAERDPLTGAFNTYKLNERLQQEIDLAKEGGDGFALIAFDLDRFKQVNDEYGRAIGDEVLIATAEAIQSVLSPLDLLVRRDDDEFFVIAPTLPDRNLKAMTLLARDRIAIARRAACPDLPPSACSGWAVYEAREDAASIIRRTEDSLVRAKRAVRYTDSESRLHRGLMDRRANLPKWAPSSESVTELRRRRAEEAAIGDDPMRGAMLVAWNTAALTTFVICAIVLAFGLTGNTSFAMTPIIYGLIGAWTLALVPIALLVPRAASSTAMEHFLCITAFVLITLTCLAVGDAAPAMVEIYMMAALLYLALLPARYALVYAGLAFGFYAAFLFAVDYPFAEIRVAMTLVNFGFIGLIIALTRRAAIDYAEEKAVLARTDPLTGLSNMRQLRARLNEEIAHSAGTGEGLALMMVDLDDFKSINEEHGHAAGDMMLQAVADALRGSARGSDLLARRGGDEFLVVMTGAGEVEAAAAALRIAANVKQVRVELAADVAPTASVGWAVWHEGDSVEDMLELADDALYDAKEGLGGGHLPEAEFA